MTNRKKLSLKKETLRTLHENDLPRAAGGGIAVSFGASCYTCNACKASVELVCKLATL